MLFVFHPKNLLKHSFQFLLGVKMAPWETEKNAYAKFWGTNKERRGMLWYFCSSQLEMIGKASSSTTSTNMPNQTIAQGKRKALFLSDTKQACLQPRPYK